MDIEKILNDVIGIAKVAGAQIMEIYNSDEALQRTDKEDGSPLTQADLQAHEVIVSTLSVLTKKTIISEESENRDVGDGDFWLVDPLDGTKDFLSRSGQFTVNIAYLENFIPQLGVIYVPAQDQCYWAMRGGGAFKDGSPIRHNREGGEALTAVCSQHHTSEEEAQKLKAMGVSDFAKKGSSLKFCHVAEGGSDLYLRVNPTMEWDVAAGHMIAEEAGCDFLSLETGATMTYGKGNLKNPGFILAKKGKASALLSLIK